MSYLVGVVSSGHGVICVIICDTVRGPGNMHGGRAVPANHCRNVGWPRDALMLKQLDAQWIELKFDLPQVVTYYLARKREGPSVPLLEGLPKSFGYKLKVFSAL